MMLFKFKKLYASGECKSTGKIYYGYLSILSGDFDHVKAGCYLSNEAGSPFAYSVNPNTVNIIVSKSK